MQENKSGCFFQNTVYNYNKLHYLKQIHKPDKLVAPGAGV